MVGDAGYTELEYGAISVLRADNGGAYPYGNSLLVRGSGGTLLVDPSMAVRDLPPSVDAIVVSHAHEDHIARLAHHDAAIHVHEDDLAAVRSLETMLASIGLPEEATRSLEKTLIDDFSVGDRPDAQGFTDGHRFDLGDRTVTVVHLPGHTPGHCGLLVEPDGFFYVADIDLSSFGPYYGDVGSSLEDFEASMQRVAGIDARWYGTFHQKGVIEGADEFRERLGAYQGVVEARDARLLEFLSEPRTVEEVAEHRLVYRPHVDEPYVGIVERRTAERHIHRLIARGVVTVEPPKRFRVVR